MTDNELLNIQILGPEGSKALKRLPISELKRLESLLYSRHRALKHLLLDGKENLQTVEVALVRWEKAHERLKIRLAYPTS